MGCLVSGLKGKEMGLVKKKETIADRVRKGGGGTVGNFILPEL